MILGGQDSHCRKRPTEDSDRGVKTVDKTRGKTRGKAQPPRVPWADMHLHEHCCRHRIGKVW
jgi:hypothetical protein